MDEDVVRAEVLQIRLSIQERLLLGEMADREGLSLSNTVRKRIGLPVNAFPRRRDREKVHQPATK